MADISFSPIQYIPICQQEKSPAVARGTVIESAPFYPSTPKTPA